MNEPVFGNIPLSCIQESPTNPRKRFDPIALDELAKSIAAHGVGQAILVRPLSVDGDNVELVEIVAGARRFRASKIAGKETIPALMRQMTDEEVIVFQTIENLQREDVHPMEEAEGYARLMKEFNYSVTQLADQVGKSREYIYGRLKLCDLGAEVRQTFYDESTLSASTALLIARIPVAKLQAQACKEILNGFGGEPMSYRRALQHIRDRYMLDLDEAPFEISDAKLVKAAGPCTTCTNRTGNQPEVFSDVGNVDVCTDPDCFESKCIAHRERIRERILAHARKVGIPIVQADHLHEAKKSLSSVGGRDLASASDNAMSFDRLADMHYAPVSNLLTPEQMPEPAGYAQLKDGKVHALYEKTAMQAALEKAGICLTEAAAKEAEAHDDDSDDQSDQIEQSEKAMLAELETKFHETLYLKILAFVESGFTTAIYRALMQFLVCEYTEISIGGLSSPMAEKFPSFNVSDDDAMVARLETASIEECECLLLDATIGCFLAVHEHSLGDLEKSPARIAILAMASAAKVDIDQVRASIFMPEAEVPAEPAPVAKKKSRKKAAPKDSSPVAPSTAADASAAGAEEVHG